MSARTSASGIVTVGVLVPVLAFALVACEKAEIRAREPEAQATADGVPFAGPWSEAFADLYRTTNDRDEREAIKDGLISDVEYSFFVDRIERCLEGVGLRDVSFGDDGWTYSRQMTTSEDRVDECLADGGAKIIALRDALAANPNNLDENEVVAKCLVREGLAPRGYTGAQYAAEAQAGELSVNPSDPRVIECLRGTDAG